MTEDERLEEEITVSKGKHGAKKKKCKHKWDRKMGFQILGGMWMIISYSRRCFKCKEWDNVNITPTPPLRRI